MTPEFKLSSDEGSIRHSKVQSFTDDNALFNTIPYDKVSANVKIASNDNKEVYVSRA
jgi:hypothetical protein